MMKHLVAVATLATLATPPLHGDPKPKDKGKDEPVGADVAFEATANPFNLTWTNICSATGEGGAFFPTCASASLFLYDNGWMELRFWNRSGLDGGWEDGAVKAIGLSAVPAGTGDRGLDVGDGWEALFGADQIDWSPENDIQGPNTGDGWKTSGNGDAFCSDIGTGCPGGITTPWTSIAGGGYAGFYWFVGDAITVLDPTKITLQMHVGSGPNGWSTGYACYSDGYEQNTFVDDKGKAWTCDDNPDDPGGPQETVPEPATMTLLATGLVGMAAARRKRNKINS
jgi:hypothetical protein